MASGTSVPSQPLTVAHLYRHQFPEKFIFGAASSAYQYEGAAEKDGRKPSIWDTFTKNHDSVIDHSDGKDAVKFYYKHKEDVQSMKDMHLDAFRFSISWPRILPDGKAGTINKKGVDFYNTLINELKENNIEPFVTLFHWDLPQALEDKFMGFLDPQIVKEFEYFADVCFAKFGDRVKYWITLNEPWSFSVGGYAMGVMAPGRCSPPELVRNSHISTLISNVGPQFSEMNYSIQPLNLDGFLPASRCHPTQMETARYFIPPATATRFSSLSAIGMRNLISEPANQLNSYHEDHGDSGKEPYLVAHHLLLAHAAVVKLYKDNYQGVQKGKIGITNLSILAVPYSEKECDKKAAERYNDFVFGWFMEPIIRGDYPDTMKEYVKDRLPSFKRDEKERLKGSFDFLGINYYTARFAREATDKDIKDTKLPQPNYLTDHRVVNAEKNCKGEMIGDQGCPGWLLVYPKGMKETLLSIKNKYKLHHVPIYITENGIAEENTESRNSTAPDVERMKYHYHHLCSVREAIKEGMNVKGYFAWSLLDNFEWHNGYTVRFGIHHVNYKDPEKNRRPKQSVNWFKILQKKTA